MWSIREAEEKKLKFQDELRKQIQSNKSKMQEQQREKQLTLEKNKVLKCFSSDTRSTVVASRCIAQVVVISDSGCSCSSSNSSCSISSSSSCCCSGISSSASSSSSSSYSSCSSSSSSNSYRGILLYGSCNLTITGAGTVGLSRKTISLKIPTPNRWSWPTLRWSDSRRSTRRNSTSEMSAA